MLEIKNLTKSFDNKLIFKNLSINIYQGQIIGIIGENGSGKSTLLKTIAGIQKPESGIGSLNKLELFTTNFSVRKEIFYTGHSPDLYGQLSAFENIQLYLNIRKEKINYSKISNCIKKFSLPLIEHKIVSTYSAGMIQRLRIVISELSKWSLGLFDEPLNALDKRGVEMFNLSLNNYKKINRTIIITSHNLNFLESICDKIMQIDNYSLIEYNTKITNSN